MSLLQQLVGVDQVYHDVTHEIRQLGAVIVITLQFE